MSNENNSNDEGNGIANLRAEFEKRGKDLEAALAELQTLRAEKRTSTVGELLKAKGLTEAHAQFYPSDADVSADAVNKWADERLSLFGVQSKQETTPPAGAQTPAGPTPASLINDAMDEQPASLPGPSTQNFIDGDPEQIMHALESLSFEELQKQGYMPANAGVYGLGPNR